MTVPTHKTNKTVVIPLHPYVKAIIEKYDGVLPKSVDKSKTNKQIRLCGKLAGIDEEVTLDRIRGGNEVLLRKHKYDFITNHTARRSFATNMYLRKAPVHSIMAITGHTTEANFMKYIKVSAEQHANIIEKHFESHEGGV
jgi:integrase